MSAARLDNRFLLRAAALLLVLACASGRGRAVAQDYSAQRAGDAIASWRLTPLDKAHLLASARAALASGEAASGSVPPNCSAGAGREVFVTVYGPKGAWVRTRASGSSLSDSVSRGAIQARVDPAFVKSGLDKTDASRIKIDVLVGQELLFPHPSLNLVLSMAPGLDGVCVSRGGKKGYVLPGEIVAQELTGKSHLLELACQDGDMPEDGWRSLETEVFRIRTVSFMERSAGGKDGRYVDLYRALPLVREADAARVESAARAAGRWLAASQSEDGSFASFYLPLDDQFERKLYNVSRHAEATCALYTLMRKTKEPALAEAGEKATAFLEKHIVPAEAPETFSFIYENIHGKVGPAALALLALLERRAATGRRDHDPDIVKMAAFLLYMQKEDGSFFPIYEFKKRVKREDIAHRYYAGQGLLALVRLYQVTKDEKLLKAALRAADYVVRQRDAELKREEPLEDEWAATALAELFEVTRDLSHAEYCLNIAETIRAHQFGPGQTPFLDYLGASDHGTAAGNPPSVAATAERCQAMNAAVALAEGMKLKSDTYRWSAAEMARLLLQNQYTPETSYYLPDPDAAFGGFRASFIEHKIELESVSASLTALLGLRREGAN